MPDEVNPIRYTPPRVMTIDEAAVYLGFAEATIRRMLRDREIPAAKVAGQWRFLTAEVDRWLSDLSRIQVAQPFQLLTDEAVDEADPMNEGKPL